MLRCGLVAETASTEALKNHYFLIVIKKKGGFFYHVIMRHIECLKQSFTLKDLHINSEAQEGSKIQMNYQCFVSLR